jgi:hypothetical protein
VNPGAASGLANYTIFSFILFRHNILTGVLTTVAMQLSQADMQGSIMSAECWEILYKAQMPLYVGRACCVIVDFYGYVSYLLSNP